MINESKKERVKRKWTDEEMKEVFELKESGMNYSQIAKKIGRTNSSVRNKLSYDGNVKKREKYNFTKEMDALILVAYDGDISSLHGLSEEIGIPADVLRGRYYRITKNIKDKKNGKKHRQKYTGCDGDCEHCPYDDCYAPEGKGASVNVSYYIHMNDGVPLPKDTDI